VALVETAMTALRFLVAELAPLMARRGKGRRNALYQGFRKRSLTD